MRRTAICALQVRPWLTYYGGIAAGDIRIYLTLNFKELPMIFLGLVFIAAGLGGCAFFLKGIYEQYQRRNDLYEQIHLKSAQQTPAPSASAKPADADTAAASA